MYTHIKECQKALFPTDASYLSEAAVQVRSIPPGSGIALQSLCMQLQPHCEAKHPQVYTAVLRMICKPQVSVGAQNMAYSQRKARQPFQ